MEDGRPWWLTNVGKRKAVSAEGRAPGCRRTGIGKVICDCGRRKLKGHRWFGSGQWGEAKKLGRWSASPKKGVREAVAVPEVVSSSGRRWMGGVRKGG